MGLVGVARDQVFGLVGKVAAHTDESVNPQTMTIDPIGTRWVSIGEAAHRGGCVVWSCPSTS
jgi:hypothetical protein